MRLTWDKTGERLYETGTDRGVLYPYKNSKYQTGVPWNGLTSFSVAPTGAEASASWADNMKYLNLISKEEFAATIGAFTYPLEFMECDGSKEVIPGVYIGQQRRIPFGLSVRTRIGNDTEYETHGYKLHLVYSAMASVSERAYATINDSPEPIEFSWEISTTPVENDFGEATSYVAIDSTVVNPDNLKKLEDILYGTEDTEARLPELSEVISILREDPNAALSISPEDGESTLLGKAVNELQSDVEILDDVVYGTLKYVTGYTGFSSVTADQEGNYLALKIPQPTDGEVTMEVVGKPESKKTLDSDKNAVIRVTGTDMKVKFSSKVGEATDYMTLSMEGLTLESKQ